MKFKLLAEFNDVEKRFLEVEQLNKRLTYIKYIAKKYTGCFCYLVEKFV